MSIKDRIKSELNAFIDGLDMEESVKEDIETESEKQETELSTETSTETIKEDGDSDGGTENTGANTGGQTSGSDSGNSSDSEQETGEGDEELPENNAGNGGTKKPVEESAKEDVTEESEKCGGSKESEKCGGKNKKVKKQAIKEDVTTEESDKCGNKKESEKCVGKKECTKEESDKSVLYLAQDDVEDLIKTTLQRYAEEIEQMVFDGIQEALDDYEFAGSFKENTTESVKEDGDLPKELDDLEKEEEEQEEELTNYATKEMVESLFEEQFASFKSELMGNIKKAQKESIKSYSKAINPESDGFHEESKKGYTGRMADRDVYGRRLRKN